MSGTFIPVDVVDYDGTVSMGAMGWMAILKYGEILALCVPGRSSPEQAKKDCEEYAEGFGWKITWKEGK